jgi:hypothetical protein
MTTTTDRQEEIANLRAGILRRKRALARAGLRQSLADVAFFARLEARIAKLEHIEAVIRETQEAMPPAPSGFILADACMVR